MKWLIKNSKIEAYNECLEILERSRIEKSVLIHVISTIKGKIKEYEEN